MNRREIIHEIDCIQADWGNKSPSEKRAANKRLKELRKMLTLNPRRERKIKAILAKGAEMKYSEAQWLQEMGITKKRIAQAVGLNPVDLNGINFTDETSVTKAKKGRPSKIKITPSQFVEMRREGKSYTDISKVAGVNFTSLYDWRKKYATEIKQAEDRTVESPHASWF